MGGAYPLKWRKQNKENGFTENKRSATFQKKGVLKGVTPVKIINISRAYATG
jgi:hypothetical protein